MGEPVPTSDEDPLVRALREENEQLREQNRLLSEQMAAVRAAQEELARHLRVTAPLRRAQESVRHRIGERRRRAASSGPSDPPATRLAPTSLDITDDQASRHPLLARTRDWLAGQPLLPEPDLRPVRTGCAGRVLVIVHVFYPELWPPIAERIALIPAPVDLVVTLVEGRSEVLADSIVAQFPERAVRGRAQPGTGHVAVRAGPRAGTGRRLRRGAQAAHQGQRAPDRRGRLARPAARLPVPLPRRDRPDPRAAAHGTRASAWSPPRARCWAASSGGPTARWWTRWRHGPGSAWIPSGCGSRAGRCSGADPGR